MAKLEELARELAKINTRIAEIKAAWKKSGMKECQFCKDELAELYAKKKPLLDQMFQLAHELGINI